MYEVNGVVGPSPNKFLTHGGSTFFIKKNLENFEIRNEEK
jgi:hypothetical protein